MNQNIKLALGLLVFIGVLVVVAFSLKAQKSAQAPEVTRKPADSQQPAAGVCIDAYGDTAQVTLQMETANPRCIKVVGSQRLELTNNSKKTISVGYSDLPKLATIDPDAVFTDTRTFGEFLEPGVHQLHTSLGSGPEIWLIDATEALEPLIKLANLDQGDSIKSPLHLSGQARGSWYFEAEFPIRILDRTGKELGSTIARAEADWMTEDFVPFSADLVFSAPGAEEGVLVFEKSNPSGLEENNEEFRLSVRFEKLGPQRLTQLYYYNQSQDTSASGQILCSKQGLVAVERSMVVTKTPIADAVRLLLLGNITSEERAKGITTEFPLPGVALKGASLSAAGILTLEFTDPENQTSGGACRTEILREQIMATAKQFPEVTSVKIIPASAFQP